jgi:predicted DNA-binding transcriptional regulator AlpA
MRMQNETQKTTGGAEQVVGDTLLDLKTVANVLGIGTRSVWRGIARGDFPPPVKIGRSCRWFTSDLLEFQERLRASRIQFGDN